MPSILTWDDFPFKLPPREHQLATLQKTATMRSFAVFWEMGCGKSKYIIDLAGYLYLIGEITGLLVVAPNGVDLNWLIDELPSHLSEEVAKVCRMWRYSTAKASTKWHKEEVKWLRQHGGFAIMLMSYDAFMTMEGKESAYKFLEERLCLYVLDESSMIKTPGAKRTMRIVRTAHRAKYRRILEGTPMTKGAFDLYSQMKFLDEDFWKHHRLDDFGMFKNYFGVFETGYNKKTQTSYDVLLGFQRLDELAKIIEPVSSRLLKKDVLKLPPKIYIPRYFEMTPLQREMYETLKEEFRVWLADGQLVTANLAMVRLLRLQQISCGYIPVQVGEPAVMINGKNPRLDLLEELVKDSDRKSIIWSRYNLDIELICGMLTRLGRSFVTYAGATPDEDRITAKEAFQRGDVQFFISNPAAGGRGLTLHAAEDVYYYTNSYNLLHRLQSEDRAHRDGLTHSVNYIDLLGRGTFDRQIMLNLCSKMDVAEKVLGDEVGIDIRSQLGEWINNDT